jgi:hypothetical protein
MSSLLPAGFEALEPFAPTLAGKTAADRAHLRDTLSREDAQAFYACAHPLLEPALDYLDRKPLAGHDEKEQRLMRLCLTFAHVAMGVEVQREVEAAHAKMRPHMRLTRAPADRP